MNGKLYIKKFIRDDGETLSFDAEEIYLSENNTLLVRSDPATTAVEFTEEDGGEMIRQRGATYSQPVSGLIVPKSTEYWALCVRLSRFFILNHTYKIIYIKKDGSMFSINRAWINAGLQIVPVPYENYSTWTIEFRIGDNFWTEYAEDDQGKEIYSNSVELPLLTAGTGGEVWSDATQQTLSGVGNYFTIDGTSIGASINKLEVRGDTYQQTYSGDNLFDYTDTQSVSTSDVTVDDEGWIAMAYDNTAGGSTHYTNYFCKPMHLSAGTNYNIVVEVKSKTSNSQYLGIISGGTQTQFIETFNLSLSDVAPGGVYRKIVTTKADISDSSIGIRTFLATGPGASNAITFRVSVLADTSITPETFTYQPYTAGPAPNPDYPQDIQVVTGEQTVEITGKNKINGSYSEISQTARCTAEASGNGFKITSTSSSGATYVTIPIPNITSLLGQTVTVSYSSSGSGIRIGFFYLASNETATGNISYTETTTLPSSLGNNAGIGVVFYTSNNGSATYNDIQLELGSTATAYQPYQSQSYEINLGKNLLNLSLTHSDHGISSTWNGNSVTISGETTGSYADLTSYDAQFLPSGTYTFSMKNTSSVYRANLRIRYNDTNYVYSIAKGSSSISFTAPTNFSIRVIYLDGFTTGTTLSGTIEFQLEKGSTATSYAPYFTPIELCKIGDYQDYIYKSGDDWCVHKEVRHLNKAVSNMNNTENFPGWTGVQEFSQDFPAGTNTSMNDLTDSWDNITGVNLKGSGRLVWGVNNNSNVLYASRNFFGSTWTQTYWTTNYPNLVVDLYYGIVNTPTDTQITNTTLVAQLNALAGAQAYSGKTVYQTNSTTMPAILSVELLQSVGGGETWDNIGAVWEEGVGGVQTINVETTQTTYPVWTVTGPCSNPTLQNDTTDTIASFDGMIASGQTLTVNFADNTAYLDSAPVAKYVSGYVSLAPGENVIGFNSDGGSTQTSTISWDNIIN